VTCWTPVEGISFEKVVFHPSTGEICGIDAEENLSLWINCTYLYSVQAERMCLSKHDVCLRVQEWKCVGVWSKFGVLQIKGNLKCRCCCKRITLEYKCEAHRQLQQLRSHTMTHDVFCYMCKVCVSVWLCTFYDYMCYVCVCVCEPDWAGFNVFQKFVSQ